MIGTAIGMLEIVPDNLRQRALDKIIDSVTDLAKDSDLTNLIGGLQHLKSDAVFIQRYKDGWEKGVQRFLDEYSVHDEDLVQAIVEDESFFENPDIQEALLAMVSKPGQLQSEDQLIIAQSFVSVFRKRINRERVDRAVTYLLKCIAEEVWYIPELLPIYSLAFQKITAETNQEQLALQKAQFLQLENLNSNFKDSMLMLIDVLIDQSSKKLLTQPTKPIIHNLPQPDYGVFVGREKELEEVEEILRPYPHSQLPVITIDGIGGIGKSSLALEIAHRYLRNFQNLDADEKFDAIIWTSAKDSYLTAEGIIPRPQIVTSIDDIFSTIAISFDNEKILRAPQNEQSELIKTILKKQRTLLIIDNMETIDDMRVNSFLNELPAPTKAIVTTRHRIGIAYPIRLTQMSAEEAEEFIRIESKKKKVQLKALESQQLITKTAGIPLALVWCIAQIGKGQQPQSVIKKLSSPYSKISQFCFDQSITLITETPAYNILLTLSLFPKDATRTSLGIVTGLSEDERDFGLESLEELSLVNKNGERFSLLPLTMSFCKRLQAENKLTVQQLLLNISNLYLNMVKSRNNSKYFQIDAIRSEEQNIIPLIESLFHESKFSEFIQLLRGINFYFWISDKWELLNKLISMGFEAASFLDEPLIYANLLLLQNSLDFYKGEFNDALRNTNEALLIYNSLWDENVYPKTREEERRVFDKNLIGITLPKKGVVECIIWLSTINLSKKEYEISREYAVEGARLAEKTNDRQNQIRANQNLGQIETRNKNFDLARQYLQKARYLRELDIESSDGLARTCRYLAEIEILTQNWSGAEAYIKESIKMGEALKSQRSIAISQVLLAKLRMHEWESSHNNFKRTEAISLINAAKPIIARLGLFLEMSRLEEIETKLTLK